MSSSDAAALKLEIARLSGAINQIKTASSGPPYARPPNSFSSGASTFKRFGHNTYINPNYKKSTSTAQATPAPSAHPQPTARTTGDVTIGGIAFVSNGRSLVRKDLAKSVTPIATLPHRSVRPPSQYTRHDPSGRRPYKPTSSARGRVPRSGNMTLNNTRRPYQPRKAAQKRVKYLDKPCPQFTTTGSCNRGLTCPYQHDPSKIAICWKFLQGTCAKTAETCELSHDPTPERTPLCVHFNNQGRCTRSGCPFPHVRVGVRPGVCRDFAVLGFCGQGLDCAHAHVRECPDFAERGECTTKGCKLPHVIRANRNRKPVSALGISVAAGAAGAPANSGSASAAPEEAPAGLSEPQPTVEDAQIGDEYISLTFHESEESEDDVSDEGSDVDDGADD